jgi:hypothetical protein
MGQETWPLPLGQVSWPLPIGELEIQPNSIALLVTH